MRNNIGKAHYQQMLFYSERYSKHGEHYGNHAQFVKRHEQIVKFINEAIARIDAHAALNGKERTP